MTPVKKTTTKKASAAKTAETVKASTKKAAETVKTSTKKAAEAVKEETKKVTAAVKEETKKVSDAVKEEPKKAAPRRTAKKTAPQVKTYVEFFGKQISTQAIAEQIENQNSDKKIETLEIYVKPEENAAYYVLNGEGSDSFRIDL